MIGKHYVLLPSGVLAFGEGLQAKDVDERVKRWYVNIANMAFFLILAGSQTAEIEGISAAGSTEVYDRISSQKKSIHLFEGLYHETFNEKEADRQEVCDALLNWVSTH